MAVLQDHLHGHHFVDAVLRVGGPVDLESKLIQSRVDLEHVVADRSRVRPLPLTHQVTFRVGGPGGVGLVDADLLEAPPHEVDQTHGEGREEIEDLADEVTARPDYGHRHQELAEVQLLGEDLLVRKGKG